jgi:hypothetical protein
MPIFLWDVESSPNYTEKLIFVGIGTITLVVGAVNWPKIAMRGLELVCYHNAESLQPK